MCHSFVEVKRLIQRFDGSVAFVINLSGGKDSNRMLGFVRECFPGATILAVMATLILNTRVPFQLRTSHGIGAQSSVFRLPSCAILAATTSR
ncbi:hypothetical protein ACPOL_6179 [Acidisarcina polymorpha]|uniref:Uncharacterized protein n=1 Tax=Acidisarcina polymorpha TaxID=2211140 RepID=A0A2Z5G813_9BACT|nr:hypothetical protein ACPOL_6179 [Acidisarcina polymorpha]